MEKENEMKKYLVFGFILTLAGLVTGCASEGAQLEMAYTAVPLTQTQMAMYATPTETPIPQAVAFAVAVEQARATSAAMEATMQWVNGQMTATAWARDERATAQAAQATSVAFAVQTTATYEAFALAVTRQAAATATAYPPTATAQAVEATRTQMAWAAQATSEANHRAVQATADAANAEIVRLALERERQTNLVRAWVPWMVFVLAIGLIGFLAVRWSEMRIVQRDAFGAAPVIVRGKVVLDPERAPGAGLVVRRDDTVDIVPGDREVTARAQQVQAIRSMPAGRQDVPQVLPGGQVPRIEVVDAEVVRDWLEDVERQAEEVE
jgi:hypothetical protein